jgi:putative PEP-CTERM system histidine kinase
MAIFIIAAAVAFLLMLYSTRLTGQLKVFLHKHFYRNKYEYRDEWLRLMRTLASDSTGAPLKERAVRAMAQIVGARGGALWQSSDEGDYLQTSAWNAGEITRRIDGQDPLIDFLSKRQWIIDTDELAADPDRYGGLVLPEQCIERCRSLVVPLLQEATLAGVIVLHEPAGSFELNYEDYDLLKTVGQQIASYLAEEEAKERLAQGKQFEAYNQLTAFIMHDLKNLIAQQSLLVGNAAKFKHNPDFVEDTIQTIDNSVQRMQHLLSQLTQGGLGSERRSIDLAEVLAEVVKRCGGRSPAPSLRGVAKPIVVRADAERLITVLCHIVRNAQDATPPNGVVRLELAQTNSRAEIKVIDSGCGMDAEFVRNRLFRPFDTTKGSKGMGIGAYQAREFVRRGGGQFFVESSIGVGTTIRIELPLQRVEEPSVTEGSARVSALSR